MCEGNIISRFYLISVLVCLAWNSRSAYAALSCKDENDNDVDWFINIKLPKIGTEKRGTDLAQGRAYAYLKPGEDSKWILSSKSIGSRDSMLGNTWKEFSNNIKGNRASYLMYNDDRPKNKTVGHLKGILAFDGQSGFWVTHSVPKFGEKNKFEFPPTAETNGQTAFCVTFNTSQLTEICNHLLYCHPNIYVQKATKPVILELMGENAFTIFTKTPAFIRKAPFLYESKLKSLGGLDIRSFAKDNQLAKDIYSEVIAPTLGTSLLAETWRRGAGNNLESACGSKHTVVDVTSIKMTASHNGQDKEIAFKSTEDHSKWAISPDVATKWVCIGDLNRMESQAKRGGGALCFQSENVWTAFKGIIENTDVCTF